MKPSKKVAAKRVVKKKPAKRAVRTGSIEHKLLQLYNRINYDETQTSKPKHIDRRWVWMLIEDLQNKKFTKLCKEDFEKCNGLWRKYD
tara:strand:- start:525 stop:788 length:264 start_codon:yes stop_codon:yes gene_type:complete